MEYQTIKTVLANYKISVGEFYIVDWFKTFSESGRQRKLVKNSKTYYWVYYPKVAEDIVQFHGKKYGCINKKFSRLVQKGIFESVCAVISGKKRVFYKFTDTVQNLLGGVVMNQSPLFDKNEVTDKIPKSGKIPVEISHLWDMLMSFKVIYDHAYIPLFYCRPSSEVKRKTTFSNIVKQIYNGDFNRRYYDISPEFIERNKIDDEHWARIRACKGNWNEIYSLLLHAAQNFMLWFDEGHEPLSKKFLLQYRNIVKWMYDGFMHQSIFLACVEKEPPLCEDKFVEDILEMLPDTVYMKAKELKRELWPSLNNHDVNLFWFGVNNVLKMERELAKVADGYMVRLWLHPDDAGRWTTEYLEWLKTCYGSNTKKFLRPWAIGPKGKAFDRWMHSDVDVMAETDVTELLQEAMQ